MSGSAIKVCPADLGHAIHQFFTAAGFNVRLEPSVTEGQVVLYVTKPDLHVAEISRSISYFEMGWMAHSRYIENIIHQWANDPRTPTEIVPDEERDPHD